MNAPQYRVVSVDDSEDDLLLLRRALRQAPSLCVAATLRDGIQAVSYLKGEDRFADRGQWPLPDLLVLDIKMPNLDGFGVLDWLARQSRKQFKVVVLTSSLSEADQLRALQMGADAVYIKPVHPTGYRDIAGMLEAQVQSTTRPTA